MTVDLRSDTFTRPTPAMRRAMAEAEVGDDVWREDPTVQRLEAAVAERLGHQAALFVPSGTMGNQICLRLAAPAGTECLANEDNHIFWYESGAAPLLSGIQLHAVPGQRGVLDPAAARRRVRTADYGVPTTAIAVEQTHNRAGGAVLPLGVLGELRRLADDAGLHLHCDGARIWNASVACGVPLDRYGRLFDTLSVCFSKGLAAPVGSAVVGDRDLVERARQVRALLGGGVRHRRPRPGEAAGRPRGAGRRRRPRPGPAGLPLRGHPGGRRPGRQRDRRRRRRMTRSTEGAASAPPDPPGTGGPPRPFGLAEVERAAGRIAGRVHRTPVLTSRLLDRELGCRVVLKAEHLQRTGAI